MKIICEIFFIIILFLIGICNAQKSIDTNKVIEAGWGSLNYAVPESPAFKILGVSNNNLMRPTSTRDIGIAIANYYINNGTSIPKNLTVEIAPSLFSPKVNLSDYQSYYTRLWYTSTFSLGTKINQGGGYDIGVGFKIKLIDQSDLRTNKQFNRSIHNLGVIINNAYSKAKDEVVERIYNERKIKYSNTLYGDVEIEVNTAVNDSTEPIYSEINERTATITSKEMSKDIDVLQNISNLRDSIKTSLWNAAVWDLGIAALFSSKDSLIEHLSAASKIGFWSTYGCPLTSNGQLLLGMNAQVTDDSLGQLNQWGGNLGMRSYYGRNDTKGFLEAESNFLHSQLPTFQVGLGLETTFAGCIWIDFSLGMKKTGSQPFVFTPGLNISYATGEKNK